MFLLVGTMFISCADVNNGERGVVYRPYGGGLDKDNVYEEGTVFGISWLWNDMIEYNVRQQTMHVEVQLLDKNSMDVPVTMSVLLRPIPSKIGYLHEDKGLDYLESFCLPVATGVLKDVVGTYTAQELVTSARDKAQLEIQTKLSSIYATNHIQCDGVIITDIDLPDAITKAIEAKQVQEERNLFSEKKRTEEVNLAAAAVAKAEGAAKVKVIEAKAQAEYIRSVQSALATSPQYVELEKVKQWKGDFGTGNVFGGGMPFINVLSNSK
jgi:regulator of protease activity HflC (stomatin/prohibitin superfamily)